MIWNNIYKVKTPVYIITPKDDEFGHFNYGSYLKRKNNKFINLKVNKSTHLFPLERPKKTAELIKVKVKFFSLPIFLGNALATILEML